MNYYEMYKNKSYNLRLPEIKKKKLQQIAKNKGIKLSVLLEAVLTDYLDQYEQEHGQIRLDGLPEQRDGDSGE